MSFLGVVKYKENRCQKTPLKRPKSMTSGPPGQIFEIFECFWKRFILSFLIGNKMFSKIKKNKSRRRLAASAGSRAEAKEVPPLLRQDKPPPVRRGCHQAAPIDSADLPFVLFLSLHACPFPLLTFPLSLRSFPLLPSTLLSMSIPFLFIFWSFENHSGIDFFKFAISCKNLVFCNKHQTGTLVLHHFPSQHLTFFYRFFLLVCVSRNQWEHFYVSFFLKEEPKGRPNAPQGPQRWPNSRPKDPKGNQKAVNKNSIPRPLFRPHGPRRSPGTPRLIEGPWTFQNAC